MFQSRLSVCTTYRTESLAKMEVKVFVDGVSRVVCGVTEETTCQDVVIALAQALGQPGRYTLRETFKDFERCMSPGERLLETLEKYGEQAKEVRLTLHHNGPSGWDEMSRTKVGRYQPCPPLRRKDAGARMRRGSGTLTLHRQSLPPLSCSTQEAEQQKEDVKKPKRKSLTLMEEAWEWLESLGKGMAYSTAADKESNKRSHKRNSLHVFLIAEDNSGLHKSKGKDQKSVKSDLDHQTSCCLGSQTKPKERKHSKKSQEAQPADRYRATSAAREEEKHQLRETIVCQLSCLQEIQFQISRVDSHISQLEGKLRARRAEQEAQQRLAEEETEQIKFWENELRAEEGYEKDLQCQFLEMKAKALGCKSRLEECKHKMQGLNYFATRVVQEEAGSHVAMDAASITSVSTKDGKQRQSDPVGNVNINRKLLPSEDLHSSPAILAPSPMKERRLTGPTELREWWTRWSEEQSSQSQTKKKVVHRSELTIYLGSTKV
ncbi:ras association domain-containing protein 8-like [Takifugu rubripes]|uniref:ras association domain-containing protein 8-like n=1 Tax=Takifugu rubripes TaxID=31033 RepID=UPI0005D18296|nr:ras association domain-containing protein 8-like [Takifugu rubripes]|eukprot:XP_011619883.1 PREDICTED: ras association domain-containing protein 8-like [Takifugu rubripes]